MSKKNRKRRNTPSSPKKSPAAEPAESNLPPATPAEHRPAWRAVLDEPVAIGLALYIFLRPWRDGLTFPSFNAFYAAGVLLLAALWGARAFLRREPIRFGVPIALLAAYLGVAYLSGFDTMLYDRTHRGLQDLGTYFLLFLIATNALRTRVSLQIVLGAFTVCVFLNASWAIVHYYQTLPAMRKILEASPEVLQQFFQTATLTEELKHRLESNRAFGTFLFPNALAAFLILGIPFCFAELLGVWRSWKDGHPILARAATDEFEPSHDRRLWNALGAGILTALMLSIPPLLLNELIGGMNSGGSRPVESMVFQIALFGVAPFLLAIAGGIMVFERGLLAYLLAARYVLLAGGLLAALFALWLSYSRGAALGLALGGFASLCLCYFAGRRPSAGTPLSRVAATLLLAGVCTWFFVGSGVRAQEVTDPGIRASDFSHYQTRRADRLQDLQTLDLEGGGRGLDKLANLGSIELRVTYWQVALLMVQSNALTGVGLGNFKTAYPSHQFLGAGDVDAAHNDYLQAFAETGLLGGSLFLAFWVYFIVWGGRRILQEGHPSHRILIAGAYAGILAFLLHSFLDFNFVNPSLAGIVYPLAGVFYARAQLLDESAPAAELQPSGSGRWVAIPALVLVALLTGAVFRTFLFDLEITKLSSGRTDAGTSRILWNIGDRKGLQRHIDVAKSFLKDFEKEQVNSMQPPYIAYWDAHALLRDQALIESFGAVRVPIQGETVTLRRLKPDELIPPTAIVFITDVPRAKAAAVTASEKRAADFGEWDSFYPHDPELSAHVFGWYDLLFASTDDIPEKKRYARLALDWSRASTERSPEEPWYRLHYAKALWLRGSIETGQSSLDYYFEGIEEYKRACELYPISPVFWSNYGQALMKLGQAFKDAGQTAKGDDLMAQSKEANRRSDRLNRYKKFLPQVGRTIADDGSISSVELTP